MSKKTVISEGHGKSAKGGYDPGAVSKDGRYEEHKIAREISKYAADYLQCKLINYDGALSLSERIKEVNRLNPDFAADIHLNAGGGTGTEAFYYHGSPTGKKAADKICSAISEEFGVKNRGAKIRLNQNGTDYFGFIRQTKPCAILVETLFIDCKSDLEKIKAQRGMKRCGTAIGKALEEAFGDNRVYLVNKDNIPVYEKADTGSKIICSLNKSEKITTTVTSYNGTFAKLKDGRGWVKLSNTNLKEKTK